MLPILRFILHVGQRLSDYNLNFMYCEKTGKTKYMMSYFNFEPSFKLRWFCARDLYGSQILVITAGFELLISSKQSRYLTHEAIKPNRLGGFGVPKFATLRQ